MHSVHDNSMVKTMYIYLSGTECLTYYSQLRELMHWTGGQTFLSARKPDNRE
jgi:hypothetical protein